MTRHIDDTPNTPGTVGYDETKPATVSGSSPGRVAPVGAAFIAFEEVTAELEAQQHANAAPRPWATGHCSYDIVGNVTDLRLSLTVEGVNYSGLVARPSGQKEVAAMLRALAEQVESGRA